MTGRGIDQILSHPGDPRLFEPRMGTALGYVALAERRNGAIPRPVDDAYIWGDALHELMRARPDARIINLETSITRSDDWSSKGINYRMSPENIGCLTAARIDCCALANNHVLDWGQAGLIETLDTLGKAGIKTAGAGADRVKAEAPAILDAPEKGRVIVLSLGTPTSGIPRDWAAAPARPGVNLLCDFSNVTADRIAAMVASLKRRNDTVVASIHWGGNWGYDVSDEQRAFARCLIDVADIDIIHGHSSHHPRPLEIYAGKLILYGCGDFLTDYESIQGYEEYRNDLVLMYLPRLARSTGRLLHLDMVPFQLRNFRLSRASRADVCWLHDVLNRECRAFNTVLRLTDDGKLTVLRS